jgi:hypothetical protein
LTVLKVKPLFTARSRSERGGDFLWCGKTARKLFDMEIGVYHYVWRAIGELLTTALRLDQVVRTSGYLPWEKEHARKVNEAKS